MANNAWHCILDAIRIRLSNILHYLLHTFILCILTNLQRGVVRFGTRLFQLQRHFAPALVLYYSIVLPKLLLSIFLSYSHFSSLCNHEGWLLKLFLPLISCIPFLFEHICCTHNFQLSRLCHCLPVLHLVIYLPEYWEKYTVCYHSVFPLLGYLVCWRGIGDPISINHKHIWI